MGNGHKFTSQQLAWLSVRSHLPRRYLAECFNLRFGTSLSLQSIKQACNTRGMTTGRSGYFEKGQKPWNAGMKGWKAGGRASETQFKKGDKPHNWVPVGTERLLDGYLQRKMTDTGYPPADWVEVHRLLWEEHQGPIPESHIVVFKDGDRTHIALDNLELISRAENAIRNKLGFGAYPDELKPALGAVVKVTATIAKLKKEAA